MAILRPFQVARRQIIPAGDLAKPRLWVFGDQFCRRQNPRISVTKNKPAPDERAVPVRHFLCRRRQAFSKLKPSHNEGPGEAPGMEAEFHMLLFVRLECEHVCAMQPD